MNLVTYIKFECFVNLMIDFLQHLFSDFLILYKCFFYFCCVLGAAKTLGTDLILVLL